MCIAPRRQARKELLTADQRRWTQIKTLQEFHRRDAEVRIFAQSGDDDWAKDLVFRKAIFLFVVVSRQTKRNSLRPLRLCGESLSALIGVNLRLIIPSALLPAVFPWCPHVFAPLRISDAKFQISYLGFEICHLQCASLVFAARPVE